MEAARGVVQTQIFRRFRLWHPPSVDPAITVDFGLEEVERVSTPQHKNTIAPQEEANSKVSQCQERKIWERGSHSAAASSSAATVPPPANQITTALAGTTSPAVNAAATSAGRPSDGSARKPELASREIEDPKKGEATMSMKEGGPGGSSRVGGGGDPSSSDDDSVEFVAEVPPVGGAEPRTHSGRGTAGAVNPTIINLVDSDDDRDPRLDPHPAPGHFGQSRGAPTQASARVREIVADARRNRHIRRRLTRPDYPDASHSAAASSRTATPAVAPPPLVAGNSSANRHDSTATEALSEQTAPPSDCQPSNTLQNTLSKALDGRDDDACRELREEFRAVNCTWPGCCSDANKTPEHVQTKWTGRLHLLGGCGHVVCYECIEGAVSHDDGVRLWSTHPAGEPHKLEFSYPFVACKIEGCPMKSRHALTLNGRCSSATNAL